MRIFFNHLEHAMRLIFTAVICLIPLLASIAQPTWVQQDGPYGGSCLSITSFGDGYAAVAFYRPYVLVSDESAMNWKSSDLPFDATVFSVLDAGGRLIAGGFGRIYLSDDEGKTWSTIIVTLMTSRPVRSLRWIDERVYAVVEHSLFVSDDRGLRWTEHGDAPQLRDIESHNGMLLGCSSMGVSRSSDGGLSWDIREQGPQHANVIRSNGNTLLLGLEHDASSAGTPTIFRSTDDGVHWIASDALDDSILDFAFFQGVCFAAGSTGLLRSFDDGVTWESVAADAPFPRKVTSLFAAKNGILAALEDIGIWLGTESGETWHFASYGAIGIGVAQVEMNSEGLLALSLRDKQLFALPHGASRWEMRHYGVTDKPSSMAVHDDVVYLGFPELLLRSNDNAHSWEYLTEGLAGRNVQTLFYSSGRLLAGVGLHGCMYSDDGGKSWTSGAQDGPEFWFDFIEVGSMIYAAAGSAIYASSDRGESWNRQETHPRMRAVYRLAAREGLLYCATEDGVYEVHPKAGNWIQVYSGPAFAVAAVEAGLIAITLNHRIIFFERFGSDWHELNNGLPNVRFVDPTVCRPELRALNGTVYLGACGLAGLWTLDISTLLHTSTRNAAPLPVNIESLHPNPASNSATLTVTLELAASVRVVIADVLGRVVKLAIDKTYPSGRHVIMLDTHEIPSGLYYVILYTGTTSYTRGLMLLRSAR